MLKEIIISKKEVSVSEILFMKYDIYPISGMLSDKNDATGYDNCIQSWVQSRKGKSWNRGKVTEKGILLLSMSDIVF